MQLSPRKGGRRISTFKKPARLNRKRKEQPANHQERGAHYNSPDIWLSFVTLGLY